MFDRLRHEFPGYPVETLPAVLSGEGWSDGNVWHNDACPIIVHQPSGIGVWCHYPDAADREVDAPRFQVEAMEWEDGAWRYDLSGLSGLFETDEADILTRSLPHFITPRALAHRFALNIEETYSDELDEIRRRNSSPEYLELGSCATHDFGDSNMAMLDAFAAVMGREPVMNEDTAESEAASQADFALMNEAWALARLTRLTLPADELPAEWLTLAWFRLTGRNVTNAAGEVITREYADGLYIERWIDGRFGIAPPDGVPTWLLTTDGPEQDMGELADLEAKLFDWAKRTGPFEGQPDALATMPTAVAAPVAAAAPVDDDPRALPPGMVFHVAAATSEDGVEWSSVIWGDGEPDYADMLAGAELEAGIALGEGLDASRITIHGPFTAGGAAIAN